MPRPGLSPGGRRDWLWMLLLALLVAGLLAGCGSQAQPVVQVQGAILAMDGQTWVVGDSLIVIPTGVQPAGSPSIGASAIVDGQRGPAGQVVAASVAIKAPPAASVQPTLAPTSAVASAQPSLVPPQPTAVPERATNPQGKGKGKGEHDQQQHGRGHGKDD